MFYTVVIYYYVADWKSDHNCEWESVYDLNVLKKVLFFKNLVRKCDPDSRQSQTKSVINLNFCYTKRMDEKNDGESVFDKSEILAYECDTSFTICIYNLICYSIEIYSYFNQWKCNKNIAVLI